MLLLLVHVQSLTLSAGKSICNNASWILDGGLLLQLHHMQPLLKLTHLSLQPQHLCRRAGAAWPHTCSSDDWCSAAPKFAYMLAAHISRLQLHCSRYKSMQQRPLAGPHSGRDNRL